MNGSSSAAAKTTTSSDAAAKTPPQPPPAEATHATGGSGYNSGKVHSPNPRETVMPDAATLRDQWRFAVRQYSRWYSQAWGTAIVAGISFFALGWCIKGSNPINSYSKHDPGLKSDHGEAKKPEVNGRESSSGTGR